MTDFLTRAQRKLFLEGIERFNCGAYFECHELLETVWREQRIPEREVTQSIIQCAVALHHLKSKNKKGALKLLLRAHEHLKPFKSAQIGINLDRLENEMTWLIEEVSMGIRTINTQAVQIHLLDELSKKD